MNISKKNKYIARANERLEFYGITMEDIVDAMPDLPPRFQKVLSVCFGLDNEFSSGDVYSYREIGDIFGVTPSHIMNIEKRALERVSQMCSAKSHEHKKNYV